MSLKKSHLALIFLCGALLPGRVTPAQNTPGTGVEQLRRLLMGGSASVVIHLSDLHGTTRALVRPVDNLVVNGAVRPRPFAGLLRGADEIIQAGQLVRVLSVEAVVGKRNDLLRITVATPGNAVAPVAFELPPGSSQTWTEKQLEALVLPALTPATTMPGTPSHPGVQAQPVASTGWIMRKTPAGTEATLHGTAQDTGRTTAALRVLGCPAVAPSQDRPAQIPFAELRVPKSSVLFDVLFVGEKDGSDNGYVHLRIGASPEIKADLAGWTLIPETGNVAPLGLDLRSREFEQLTSAAGVPLRVAVLPTDKPGTGVTAQFTLPADVAGLQAAMAPCLEKARAAEIALHASHSAECPELPDLVLLTADVRRAATGKSLAVDPEHDQGVGWVLPKATKAHPVPQKTVLVCSYGPPNQQATPRKVTRVETQPIPSTAAYCESFIMTAESRSYASCQR